MAKLKCPFCDYWTESKTARNNLKTHLQVRHPERRVVFRDGRKQRGGPDFTVVSIADPEAK